MSGDAGGTVALIAPFAGWLAPLEEVPDPVFAEHMMGDGLAIDPIEGVLRAPADGEVLSIPASAHAVTLRLRNGAELLVHIGLETVALGGKGFTPRVVPGAQVRAGEPLIAFDLDALAGSVKALITPLVVANEGYVLHREPPGPVEAGAPVARVERIAAEQAGTNALPGERHERMLTVAAPHGIHARPAARIAAALKPFAAEVTLRRGDRIANARSTVALLGLGAVHGEQVMATATGSDARAAVETLAALLDRIAGEEAAEPLPVVVRPPAGGPVTASPGLAIGRALQLRLTEVEVPVDGADVAHERASLATALAQVSAALVGGSKAASAIGEAHRALLADPELLAAAEHQIALGHSAAFAWRAASRAAAAAIGATGDPLLMERVADLADLERQVIGTLTGEGAPTLPAIAPDTILIAEDLLPSQFLALDRSRLAGICTAAGGPTAHVAILAASAAVPMIVAAGRGVLDIPDGATLILDADVPSLVAEPDASALAAASEKLAEARGRRAAEIATAQQECRMADGTRIEIFANLGSVDDAAAAVRAGAEGCGLLRTEFLFLERETAPDEDEQRNAYAQIAATLGDRPLILRTLDIGGDKPVPYLPLVAEENPALGVRGIRLSLARPDLLRLQFRAALRAVPAAQCRIMLPMVADLSDYRAAQALLGEVAEELGMAPPPLGVMIETPAAAMLAGQIAREAAFLSIGTNDLTQYALAADRGNAGVSQRIDAMHPAVLRLVREVGRGARGAGRWAGMCGGLAADPLAAPILIGLGITELSVPPAAIPRLKAVVRTLDTAACAAIAERACEAESPEAVRAIAREVAP